MSTSTQLVSVRAAIEKIESSGQSGSWADKTVEMGQLKDLYAREEQLIRRLAVESGLGLTRNVGVINRG